MYDEDEKTPLFAMILGTWLLRLFVPRQPIWRFFILVRKAQAWSGISLLRRAAFALSNRRALRKFDQPAQAPEIVPEPISRERIGNALAGLSVLGTVALGYFLSPLWFLATAGIAVNLAVTSVLNRCVVKSLLTRLGIPGERDLGRAETLKESREADVLPSNAAPVSRLVRVGNRWKAPVS